MPQKLNKAGQMQDYIPKGNGDASGEYGTSNGTNKNFTTSDKKKTEANVIAENKSVVVGDKEWLKNKIDETAKKKAKLDEKNSTRNVYGTEEERDREGAKKLGVSLEEYKKLKEQHKKEMADIFEDKETKKDFSNSRELREYYDEKYEEIRDKYAVEKDQIKKAEYEKQMDKIQEERKEAYSKLKENGKEVIYDGKKEIKANVIDNDLTGKGNSIQEAYNLLNSDNIESIEYEMNWKNTSSGRDNLTFNKKLDDKNKFLNMLDATYGSKKQLEKNLAFSHQTNYLILKVKEKGHRAKEVKLSYEDLIKLNNKITGKRTKQ